MRAAILIFALAHCAAANAQTPADVWQWLNLVDGCGPAPTAREVSRSHWWDAPTWDASKGEWVAKDTTTNTTYRAKPRGKWFKASNRRWGIIGTQCQIVGGQKRCSPVYGWISE